MSWIPVYGNTISKANVFNTSKATWLQNGLTHIGLQYWVPGDNGDVVFRTNYQYQNQAATIASDVQDYVTWGKNNGVKIMLTLHNVHANGFDWSLAQKVINDYPTQTIANLISIVNTYDLAGVDIDLEGVGAYGADKAAFISFVDALGKALRNINKELSVALFSTPCYNYPNPSWESDLAPHVDFMNIMGYAESYEKNTKTYPSCPVTPSEANAFVHRYSYIENFATVTEGIAESKLNIGIPGTVTSWGGDSLYTHLCDIASVSSTGGIALWDLRLTGKGLWLEEKTWELIGMFKDGATVQQLQNKINSTNTVSTPSVKDKNNPVHYNYINETINFSSSNGVAYLYDVTGQLIEQITIKENDMISLSEKSTGVYILKYYSDNDSYVLKIMVRD